MFLNGEFPSKNAWWNQATRWDDFLFDMMTWQVLKTLNGRGSLTLGKNTTLLQTEVYPIFSCSDFCRKVELQDMIICSFSCLSGFILRRALNWGITATLKSKNYVLEVVNRLYMNFQLIRLKF
jgi:hypothetical protein